MFQVPDEKELLWGSRPPLLPPAISDRLFGEPEERDSEDLGTEEHTFDYSEEEIDTPDRDKRAYKASADDTQASVHFSRADLKYRCSDEAHHGAAQK